MRRIKKTSKGISTNLYRIFILSIGVPTIVLAVVIFTLFSSYYSDVNERSIDQGGCFETSKATTHAEPTYIIDDIVHYCVANMPGAVARTSTYALNAVTLTHAKAIAKKGWKQALIDNPHLKNGLNVAEGKLTYDAVGKALKLKSINPDELLK